MKAKATQSGPTLSTRAMLASLNIQSWSAVMTDKAITAEVAKRHKVAERTGKYRKNSIDVDAGTYKAVITAKSNLRNRYYEMTLPWGQDGSRILTTAMFPKFSEEMRTLKYLFESAVRDFVADYPNLKAQARRDLNGMFNESDYPLNIAAKFDCRWHFNPLPESADFRASLSDDAVAEIREDIETQLKRTTEIAMREPYRRLYDHISKMAERLQDSKSRTKKGKEKAQPFRDSLVTNLAELCKLLPALNLTGDETLAALHARTAKMIENLDPQQLRTVPSIRRNVAREAQDIQNSMAAFMGQIEGEE